jgi:DNA-binding response OmpR family regulator
MLTDLNMPHLDGLSAFQRISAERPGMKVLFISGDTFRPQLSGSWPFLSKPFGLQEILARVREILQDGPPSDLKEIPYGKSETVTAR